MRELALHSLHADGEHLILADGSGAQYQLRIDDALRVAIRGDRPHLETIRAGERSALRPRDIQARIRAGASAAEIADSEGIPLAAVERYEGPVLAERAWMVEQTQLLAIGHEVGAPTLGDLVVDRIAARGLSTAVAWDAHRIQGEPWQVTVRFDTDQRRSATWHVDLQARSLTAIDDESRLLSETDLTGRRGRGPFDVEAEDSRRGADVVIARGGGNPGTSSTAAAAGAIAGASKSGASTASAAGSAAADTAKSGTATSEGGDAAGGATDVLLERLERARGRRGQAAPPTSEHREATEDASEHASDDGLFPAAPVLAFRGPRGGSDDAAPSPTPQPAVVDDALTGDAEHDDDGEPHSEEETAPDRTAKSRGRSRRTSVPTWDEIVFGSKSE